MWLGMPPGRACLPARQVSARSGLTCRRLARTAAWTPGAACRLRIWAGKSRPKCAIGILRQEPAAASNAENWTKRIPGRDTPKTQVISCLLYTSDAADDLLCVDL